jgi:hypothetical protein
LIAAQAGPGGADGGSLDNPRFLYASVDFPASADEQRNQFIHGNLNPTSVAAAQDPAASSP